MYNEYTFCNNAAIPLKEVCLVCMSSLHMPSLPPFAIAGLHNQSWRFPLLSWSTYCVFAARVRHANDLLWFCGLSLLTERGRQRVPVFGVTNGAEEAAAAAAAAAA